MRSARLARPVLAIVSFVVMVGASAPAALDPGSIRSFAEQGGGASAGGGTGGTLLSTLAPLLLIALAVALVIVATAVVILLRTRGAVTPPVNAEGWWTCSNCGAGNMDGASRCHACSTWRTTTPRSNPTAQP